MSLPKKIRVFGYSIAIREVPLEGLHGLCDFDRKKILIGEDATDAEKAATLFHEVIHMCLAIGGISHALEDKQEEAIVRCIENGLWPIIQDMWAVNALPKSKGTVNEQD